MFGKAKLQQLLEEKEKEIKELSAKLEEYQKRNEAVVNALTEAKSAANRIIAAAEVKRDEILADAEQQRKDIIAKCDGFIAQAESKADGIIQDATNKAASIQGAAEDAAKVAEEKARIFKAYIKDTADSVRRQAEGYAAFLNNYENMGIGAAPVGAKVETQDDYANPAELMRSIYAIEGRELPCNEEECEGECGGECEECSCEGETACECADASEEKVWTVEDVLSDAIKQAEEEVPVDKQLDDMINDILKLD